MDKKLYILSKILIDNGTKVNDIVFESYPYDVQFHMLPYLWRHFEYCGLYNNNEEKAIINTVKNKINKEKYDGRIITEIKEFSNFYYAEELHQNYLISL